MGFESLPVELKSEVFQHCLSEVGLPILGRRGMPTSLLQVCQSWREVSMSSPRLWQAFQITLSEAGLRRVTGNRILDTLCLWLRLSANVPLSVTFSYMLPRKHSIPNLDQLAVDLMSSLCKHSARWINMELLVPNTCINALQSHLDNTTALALKHFTIEVQRGIEPSSRLSILNLRPLWKEVTELSLVPEYSDRFTLDDCIDILSGTLLVEVCSLSVDCILRGSLYDFVPCALLQNLHIALHLNETNDHSHQNFISFFEILQLRSLRKLELEWFGCTKEMLSEDYGRMVAAFHRLGTTLEDLRMTNVPLSQQQLISCFGVLPLLTDVKVAVSLGDDEDGPLSNALLLSLQVFPGQTPLLPRLKSLDLQCSGKTWSEKAVIDLIESRRIIKGGSFVRMHCFAMRDTFDSEELAERRECWAAGGMDIQMRFLSLA
jgi:hypothetical protein